MHLETGYSTARLTLATQDEAEWLKAFLTFKTYPFRGRKRREEVRCYLGYKNRFPVGFVPMVKRLAGKEGMQVSVTDVRGPAPPANPAADLSWLYPHQLDAVQTALQKTTGVIASPTGSGKGEIAAGIVWSVDCNWLILVHRDHLCEDLANRYRRVSGCEPGFIRAKSSGGWDPKKVTFATFASLHANLGTPKANAYLQTVEGLLVDEAHVVAADTFSACAVACRYAYYRLGLSGTPFDRTDAKSIGVIAAIGPPIVRIKTQFLIDEGYIARPTIRMVPHHQVPKEDWKTFATVYKKLVEGSASRNDVCLDIMLRMEKPGFAFVKKRAHGLALLRLAEQAGLNVAYVDGKRSNDAKTEAIAALRRGAVDLVICTVVFQEGVDVPELRSVANFASGASVIAALQRIGRGMRIDGGHDTFEVWDIYDGGQKWLANHARARAKAFHREGHVVSIGLPDDPEPFAFNPDSRIDWSQP